jgi:hypothetical protein
VEGFDGCFKFFPVEAHVRFDIVVPFDDGVYVMVELSARFCGEEDRRPGIY